MSTRPAMLPIALWLVPARPWHERFEATIAALGRSHDGPAFEPHVTLHVGEVPRPAPGGSLGASLAAAAASLRPLELVAGTTRHSDAHFKTLFVEFADSRVAAMRDALCAALGVTGDFALSPHLSLLYHGGLPEATRAALAATYVHHGEPIRFDRVVAVLPPPGGALSDITAIDTSVRCRLGTGDGQR